MLPSGARTAIVLLMFVALLLAAALHLLAASGHFPREHRGVRLNSAPGQIILFGSMAATAVCVVAGSIAAVRLIPWSFAIIAAGLAILAAPLALRQFRDRFVDGPIALLTFCGCAAASNLFLLWMASAASIAAAW